ncbi:MAG: CBS domain-containing protein [Candidatus Diapherotrites archaeon]
MKVSDVCGENDFVGTALAGDSIEKVISAMGENKQTRTVFVVDGEGRLIGAITIQDIFEKIFDEMKPRITKWFEKKKGMTATDIMKPVIAVSPDDDLEDALRAAAAAKLQDLPVCRGGKVVAALDCFELLYGLVEKGSKYFRP